MACRVDRKQISRSQPVESGSDLGTWHKYFFCFLFFCFLLLLYSGCRCVVFLFLLLFCGRLVVWVNARVGHLDRSLCCEGFVL